MKAIAAQHGHLEWQKIAEELGVRSGPAETLRAVSVRGPRFEAFMGCVTHSQGCPMGPLRVCLSGWVTRPTPPWAASVEALSS